MITGANIADAVFNGLRAAIGACQGSVRLDGVTSIDAIVQSYEADRAKSELGVDLGITGTAYIRLTDFSSIPSNQKLEVDIGDGNGFVFRRLIMQSVKAQAVVRLDYGDLFND